MAIIPDTKDWTWVLRRPCPECGFDTSRFARDEVAGMVLANAASWRGVLTGAGDVRVRPLPDKWSSLEYGCHVRDVLRVYDRRLQLMLTEEDPGFENWDQDATAIAERYGEQDPATVAAELDEAAQGLSVRFSGLKGGQWHRTGTRSDGVHFTVESFARYFIHDPIHHLYDATGIRHVG